MSAVVSQSELLRRAAAWIDEERSLHPEQPLAQILDEASMRFNLNPKDFLILEHLFTPPVEERKKL